jgi:mRNA interferase RelE/StbE
VKYSVEFRPAVLKSMKRISKKDLRRIKNKVDDLAENLPDPTTTKMKGNNPFHRVRTGNYRIIYKILEDRVVILVVKVGHRKDVYKRLL